MIFLGTWPQAVSPGIMKCRVRNRPGVWVIMDSKYWKELKGYDLYMDYTKQVWAQNQMGVRTRLQEIDGYVVESQIR